MLAVNQQEIRLTIGGTVSRWTALLRLFSWLFAAAAILCLSNQTLDSHQVVEQIWISAGQQQRIVLFYFKLFRYVSPS